MLTLAEKKNPRNKQTKKKNKNKTKQKTEGCFVKNQTRDENISTQQREIIVARGRVGQCTQAD